jgi:hypothetical protein
MSNLDRLRLPPMNPGRAILSWVVLALSLTLSACAMKVVSDNTATGFKFPESCAYDPEGKVLYVGSFGGTELKPAVMVVVPDLVKSELRMIKLGN